MRRIFTSCILASLATLLLVLTWRGPNGLLHLRAINNEATAIEEKTAELNSEIRRVKREIQAIQSGGLALEKLARAELGLYRPGEIVYVFDSRDERSR
jgi:cell division protein FtsB